PSRLTSFSHHEDGDHLALHSFPTRRSSDLGASAKPNGPSINIHTIDKNNGTSTMKMSIPLQLANAPNTVKAPESQVKTLPITWNGPPSKSNSRAPAPKLRMFNNASKASETTVEDPLDRKSTRLNSSHV